MARHINGFTPEFTDWLKSNKVSIRKLHKNPESLGQYYQEWVKSNRRERRQSRLRLSNLNLNIDTIVNGVHIANEVIRTFQGTNGLANLFRFK